LILVDTSAWIDFFRGREPLASAVDEALAANEAAICGPIETELRRGLARQERGRVLPLLSACHLLPQPDQLWKEAGEFGYALRRRGVTVKTLDLLITVYAVASRSSLLTADSDFATIRDAGVSLELMSVR
jgi:tRNA(fMet)-specific endonuclease VapC